MAGDTSTSGQLIALPTGGGAVRGLGETFAPDPHTGTGNLAVPISLPPGVNGLRPDLSLAYSTGHGNGAFGLGWSLNLPGIARKTSRGVPRYDGRDVFVHSGGEDLVPVGERRYRPRTEGSFARVEHHVEDLADFWTVAGLDGLVSRYEAVVANPGRRSAIFAWHLTQTADPFNNLIEYAWRRDSGTDGPHWWDQLYPERIRYGIATISFEYEERPDPFSDHRAGFEIRTRLRCTAIHVHTTGPVRGYHLTYDTAANGVSLLTRIQVVGYDDDGKPYDDLAPPLEFGYTRFAPEGRAFTPVPGTTLPTRSLANPELRLADLFGTGLPDLVELNGNARYWRNLGDGRFDPPRPVPDLPAGVSLTKPGVQLLDADGDGRIDLLATQSGMAGYYPLDLAGGPRRRAFHRYAYAPTVRLDDPEVALVDIDGDGVVDVVRSGARFEVYYNDPRHGFDPARTRRVARRSAATFPDVSFADPRVRWADMTGDGLADVVLVHDGNIEYWPNLGHGDFGPRVHMRQSPDLPTGYDPKRLLLGDVDGDGLADLVYVDHGRVLVWLNQSGHAWGEVTEVTGTPPGVPAAVRLEDLRGTGTRGVVWSADATTPGRPHLFFLDLTGGVKPYLLDRIDNRLGAVTTIGYASSTSYYLADQARASTRWRAGLPFPVHVVARMSTVDVLAATRLTREYRYHHGCWDGGEREFRGFGLVDVVDAETQGDQPLTPPLLTRTWFHLGPVGEEFGEWDERWATGVVAPRTPFMAGLPRRARRDAVRALRGQVLRTEVYALDGTARAPLPYSVTESTWEVAEVVDGPDAPATRVFVPLRTSERTTNSERGDDPRVTHAVFDRFDAYARPGRQTTVACPRGWRDAADRPTAPYLATRVVTTYADSTDAYPRDRVARVTNWAIADTAGLRLDEVLELPDDDPRLVPIAHQLNYFDGKEFTGLPLGEVGRFGALTRSERLVLTPDLARAAYGADVPPYLSGGPWDPDYPTDFQAIADAGYTYLDDADHIPGWYAQIERCRFDFHADEATAAGLALVRRDALGRETTAEYDAYGLLPRRVSVALGPARTLESTVDYNYRVGQARRAVDENGNVCEFEFSPLGLLEAVWAKGADDPRWPEGDRSVPHLVYTYDLTAFHRSGQPASVRTLRRIYHDTVSHVPPVERDRVVEQCDYSDGFGRVLQTRTQDAAVRFLTDVGEELLGRLDGPDVVGVENTSATRPNVVVRDCHVYDNKGNVVERYEPYADVGWDWVPPDPALRRTVLRYDPHGQVVSTLHPDGTRQLVVNGVPADLTRPDEFAPTPWETYTYDANDLAPVSTSPRTAPVEHHYTPKSVETDALGRVVRTTERTGSTSIVTRFDYDPRGNLTRAVDALGRTALDSVYDLADQGLLTISPDSGERRSAYDAAGRLLESRESTGAWTLRAYDIGGRLTRLWGRDATGEPVTLRERRTYGDEVPGVRNSRGRLVRHDDEAGTSVFGDYDFAGRPTTRLRRAFRDDVVLAPFDTPPADWAVTPFRPDWDVHTDTDLDDALETDWEYDALGRVTLLRAPRDADGRRAELRHEYDDASRLTRLTVDGVPYVERMGHDARGQRLVVVYGNGVLTRHTWDPDAFLLTNTRTEQANATGPLSWEPTGKGVLQDTTYGYDLAGNLLRLVEQSPGCGVSPTPDRLVRDFAYDPLYRLLSATGREADTRAYDPPWLDTPPGDDPKRTRAYRESYSYDDTGTPLALKHTRFGRDLTKLDTAYDASGNLIRETSSRHYEWDHAGRLRAYRTQTSGAEPTTHATYLYDSAGQRVKKVVRAAGGTWESTTSVDGVFEAHTRVRQGVTANTTLHLLDGVRRLARIRVGKPFPGDGAADAPVTYCLGDHLGSAEVVVGGQDATGRDFVRREEFTPYGETSFGGYGRKRYRFTGKERDEESGLTYHGARYYAPWQARWVSCDPTLALDDLNRYRYARGSPMVFRDDNGRFAEAGFLAAAGISAPAGGAAVGTGAAAAVGGGGAAAGGGGAAAATGGGAVAAVAVPVGIGLAVLAVMAGWVAFSLRASQRSEDLAAQRLQRTNLAHNLLEQDLISWEDANEYILTGQLFIPKDGPASSQDAYRDRWFELGRQFQQHVLETRLKTLYESGQLDVEERIATKKGIRAPDFAARDPNVPGAYKWIGDAKLGRVELDDQMRGFIEEAKRTTMKTLVLFVPEGATVPDSVYRVARRHGVTIKLIEVAWQPEYIPKEGAGKKLEQAPKPKPAPAPEAKKPKK